MDKQQIKSRFFGAYFGAPVKCFDMVETHGANSGVFKQLNGAFYCEMKINDKLSVCEFLAHCKLVLRPLSSITDEEAIEAAKMLGGNVCEWSVSFRDDTRLEVEPNLYIGRVSFRYSTIDRMEVVMGSCEPTEVDTLAVFDYLRSINICVPFMGLDPIEEGWAILEDKIPANDK